MELSLITCNIRFDNPADADNDWSHRRTFLAETLLKHSPDIIGTQEGRFQQLKDLESLLPDFEMIDQHRSWIKERMYPTFFLRKNKFEFLQSGDNWLSETPDVAGSLSFGSAFPRLMTWTRVQLKNSDQQLMLVNTHLDHIKRETRVCQAKVLSTEIKKYRSENSALFILGDFNDAPESDVRMIFNKNFPEIQDAWALKNVVEESSHHAFKGEISNGARIDWILVDKKFQIKNCFMEKASRLNKYPTDHFPIVCHVSS